MWEEGQRERRRHRQRKKQAPCRETDVGLDPRSPGSRPGPKAGTKLLSHPGIPQRPCFIPVGRSTYGMSRQWVDISSSRTIIIWCLLITSRKIKESYTCMCVRKGLEGQLTTSCPRWLPPREWEWREQGEEALFALCMPYSFFFKKHMLGQPRWRSGLAPPAAQGVILETPDGVPHRAFCMEPASPSACVSASLSLSLNKY